MRRLVARWLPEAWWLPRGLRHTPAGTVWINQRKLIELQRNALRARDLERETEELGRSTRVIEAGIRASELLAGRRASGGLDVASTVEGEVLADLPLTAEGQLHEQAFLALVDARVWALREQQLFARTT